jgi:hypothetical protein
METKREVWQRGPVENIPALLQPVAHALLQASEELKDIMQKFPEQYLWEKPAGVASPGFHLQHLSGVLSRLFTYARGESLTNGQLYALSTEGDKTKCGQSSLELIEVFDKQVSSCLSELEKTHAGSLTQIRTIGRKQIPTTVIGLYVHAAEHTMRHVGQLLVTVKVIKANFSSE